MSIPSAIIFISNNLNDDVRDHFVTHLYIDESITGEEFDNRILNDANYAQQIHLSNLRIMVERDLSDITNRELADIVVYFHNGMISVEKNKFGPPCFSLKAADLHWGKLHIFGGIYYGCYCN